MSDKIIYSKDKIDEDFQHYRKVLTYMGGNVPLEALCLPKVIENALLRDGCLRVYDLINRDLSKVKGLGRARVDFLRARLDEFFTISI